MAYTCIYAPSHECDGCGDCDKDRDCPDEWAEEYDEDEEYCRYCDRMEE